MNANTDCLKIPGYEFWIESDEERLKQYQTQTTNESVSTVVSCYIPSKVGKEFRIGFRRLKYNHPVQVNFYLNDDCVDKRLLQTISQEAFDGFISHVVTQNQKWRFAFATINYEEDERAELTSIPKNLGTIRLEVFRIKNICEIQPQPPSFQVNTLNISTLSEKAKTISSHTISLLKPEPAVENIKTSTCDYIDSLKTPWYTIKFFYRPLDILQAEGIAPAPLPKPALSDEPPSRVMAERNMNRQPPSTDSGFTEDRKSTVKSIKSESFKVNTPKVATSREQPIVIEDSDEEDSKYLLKEKIKVEKRSRVSSDVQGGRKKRIRDISDDPVIIIDSD